MDKLIVFGEELLSKTKGKDGSYLADKSGVRAWAHELILLKSIAGDMVQPWKTSLDFSPRCAMADQFEQAVSALKIIKQAVEQGLLTRYEDLVAAEMFCDLIGQAEYLLSKGYHLAAGVILRAVLEEKPRKLCVQNSCTPIKQDATINDYNGALYTASPPVYDTVTMKHVDGMAAIENDAAHNKPSLRKEDVERFSQELPTFLERFSAVGP